MGDRRPGIAGILRGVLGVIDVPLLGVGERPQLIDLDSAGRHVANVLVVVGGASGPGVLREPGHSVDPDTLDPGDPAHRRAFNQLPDD